MQHRHIEDIESQALYVLCRVLKAGDRADLVFVPEGSEDLSVHKRDGTLVEVVQVKDHSADLTLSDFNPGRPDSFFYRSGDMLRANPQARLILATYGPVGSELRAALSGDLQARDKLARKLSNYGPAGNTNDKPKQQKNDAPKQHYVTLAEAEAVVSKLEVVPLDEPDLYEGILAQLREGAPGVDVERRALQNCSCGVPKCLRGAFSSLLHAGVGRIYRFSRRRSRFSHPHWSVLPALRPPC